MYIYIYVIIFESRTVFLPKELFLSSEVALPGRISVLRCCGCTDNDPDKVVPTFQQTWPENRGKIVILWDLPWIDHDLPIT